MFTLTAAWEIGLQEGIRMSLFVVGVSFTWRVARIPDLSSYASYVMGAALAAIVYKNEWPVLVAFPIELSIGAVVGGTVFFLWRRVGLNILLVGVLVTYLGFSVASAMMSFDALRPTSKLLVESPTGQLPIAHHWLALGIACIAMATFFESSWGSNLFVWSRSQPLATNKWIKSFRSPDLASLIIGNVCTAVSGFLMAQDHGEFNLQEGKELLFIALVSLVVGEMVVILLRSIVMLVRYGLRQCRTRHVTSVPASNDAPAAQSRAFLGEYHRFFRQRFGFVLPLSLILAAPLGAVAYWVLVNLSDQVLKDVGAVYFAGRDLSGLSRGIVALMAIACLSLLHIVGAKETTYEPWRFRG